MDLANKTILITGGARVGQFVADELLRAGAQLAMTYLNQPSETHPKTKAYHANLTNEADIHALIKNVTIDFGAIDGLVNMVSVFKPDSNQLTFAEMQGQFTLNAFGNMLVSRLFVAAAKQRGAQNVPIVSFIDWAVDHPYSRYDVYIAAKAALRHYLMALQTTFHGTVRVVNIHPGIILEPTNFPRKEKDEIIRHTPTSDIGTPQQAAQLVRTALELDYLVDNIHLAGGQQWRHRLK